PGCVVDCGCNPADCVLEFGLRGPDMADDFRQVFQEAVETGGQLANLVVGFYLQALGQVSALLRHGGHGSGNPADWLEQLGRQQGDQHQGDNCGDNAHQNVLNRCLANIGVELIGGDFGNNLPANARYRQAVE